MAKGPTRYTVSDGKLMLQLEVAEEGGFIVTSPLDPRIITQAETLEEAFEMAYDVVECYREMEKEKVKANGRSTSPKSRRGAKKRGARV